MEMVKDSVKKILAKVLGGHELLFHEAMALTRISDADLPELLQAADTLTRRNFQRKVSMCAIYPAKVGRCSADCGFCAQSVYHNCQVDPLQVADLERETIIQNAQELERLGVKHYSLVTSGEFLTEKEFSAILSLYQCLKSATKIRLCASLGKLTLERAQQLKAVGVTRYHHNIETSRSFFGEICTTHTYDEKIETLQIAQKAGLELCCGGIISMGESAEQRIEMAFALKALAVDSIPINILNPILGTRLENQPPLPVAEILKTIAIFRLILPEKTLRFAGGREKALGESEYRGYTAGINALLVGNYLTTAGKGFAEEMQHLQNLDFELER